MARKLMARQRQQAANRRMGRLAQLVVIGKARTCLIPASSTHSVRSAKALHQDQPEIPKGSADADAGIALERVAS